MKRCHSNYKSFHCEICFHSKILIYKVSNKRFMNEKKKICQLFISTDKIVEWMKLVTQFIFLFSICSRKIWHSSLWRNGIVLSSSKSKTPIDIGWSSKYRKTWATITSVGGYLTFQCSSSTYAINVTLLYNLLIKIRLTAK